MPIKHNASFEAELSPGEIVLWADTWRNRKELVKGRIMSLLGLNHKVAAREAQIVELDKDSCDSFLEANHLMGTTGAKYKIGLLYKSILVSVATFGAPKTFYRANNEPFQSVELIRYASLSGLNVMGGLSKMLLHFVANYLPDDIMTYADREWSSGETYESMGFAQVEITPPLAFWISPDELKRYPENRLPKTILEAFADPTMRESQMVHNGYCKIYNKGNFKYLLNLKDLADGQ